MGTHPSGPSTLAEGPLSGEELLAYIRDHPEVLGDAAPKFGVDLPFLFKVLSVKTALSIQSHPDKALAERLHAQRPNEYKDNNHKPEMTVALSDFESLCGFCPHEEIASALQNNPELRECCGTEASDGYIASTPENRKEALKTVFTGLMTAHRPLVHETLARIVCRLKKKKEESASSNSAGLSEKEQLVLRLNEQWPGDVGVFAAWFFNYITLQQGQAIALAANEPHAYLSGEIVECMATSDNVLRAGLTLKHRDTEVLCDSLTYSQGKSELLDGIEDKSRHLVVYRPNFQEFEVWKFNPPAGSTTDLPAAKGPLIVLIQHGSGTLEPGNGENGSAGRKREVSRGQVMFVPAGLPLKATAKSEMVVWIAAANGMGF
jgi:mannose-6-phosphate isomerase